MPFASLKIWRDDGIFTAAVRVFRCAARLPPQFLAAAERVGRLRLRCPELNRSADDFSISARIISMLTQSSLNLFASGVGKGMHHQLPFCAGYCLHMHSSDAHPAGTSSPPGSGARRADGAMALLKKVAAVLALISAWTLVVMLVFDQVPREACGARCSDCACSQRTRLAAWCGAYSVAGG